MQGLPTFHFLPPWKMAYRCKNVATCYSNSRPININICYHERIQSTRQPIEIFKSMKKSFIS
jgi:hypothetical protein